MPQEKPDSQADNLGFEPGLVTWRDFLDYVERLRAEAPEEFEGFLGDYPNRCSTHRDVFEGWEE